MEYLTRRPINEGAEKWIDVTVPVLDHGFVNLLDYMGGDVDIERAARISYGQETRKINETKGLVRYLLRHEHTSPFEMVEFKFHQKMPLFVARQWVRHRTASLNEYSARYSVVRDEFYIPEAGVISVQSSDNKQGRGPEVDPSLAQEVQDKLRTHFRNSHDLYLWLLDEDIGAGLAREIARLPLPVAVYTEWYWKCDLHNILHLLNLRMDKHAQYEIRVHAEAMANIVKDSVPITWQAFEEYQLNAVKINEFEITTLRDMLLARNVHFSSEEIEQRAKNAGLTNKREIQEMVEKVRKMGLIQE